MTWTEAILLVVAESGHQRYYWLCSDENPDAEQREAYRALMVRKATGQAEPVPPPPRAEVIPGLGSLADLPGPARIEPGCRPCH